MNMPIYVLNGPNLNRLGEREPEIYGRTTLAQIEALCRHAAGAHAIDFRQTNSEAQMIDWLHEAVDRAGGVVINPAAWSFTSIAILDALKMFPGPIVEVHLSNPNGREPWRHTSVVAPVATGSIMGFGGHGYVLAVDAVAAALGRPDPRG